MVLVFFNMRESLDCIYYSCSKKRFFTLEASVDAQNCVLQFVLIGIKISQSQFCPKFFSDHWYVPCSINLTSHSHLILRHRGATQHRSLIVVLWIKPPFNQYADQIKKIPPSGSVSLISGLSTGILWNEEVQIDCTWEESITMGGAHPIIRIAHSTKIDSREEINC